MPLPWTMCEMNPIRLQQNKITLYYNRILFFAKNWGLRLRKPPFLSKHIRSNILVFKFYINSSISKSNAPNSILIGQYQKVMPISLATEIRDPVPYFHGNYQFVRNLCMNTQFEVPPEN